MPADPPDPAVEPDAPAGALRRGPVRDEDPLTIGWDALDRDGRTIGELRALPIGRSSDAARFEAMCRAAAIDHPHVVAIREVGRDAEGRAFCLLEVDDGAPFQAISVLASPGRMVPARVAAWVVRDACVAALALRARGQELAPAMGALDVGALRIARDGHARIDPVRAIARALETDARADEPAAVRALGAILHELTTGARPGRDRIAPGELVRGFPEGLDDAIVSALRATSGEGLARLDALAESLDDWLASEGATRDEVAAWIGSALERAPQRAPARVDAADGPLPAEPLRAEPRPPSLREQLGLGRLLDGKYRLDRVLGSGGMAVVFAGTHVAMQRPVAVKVLTPRVAGRRELVARFLREARIAGALAHPGLAAVHDVGEHDGAYYLVMERLEGETLREHLDRGSALESARAVSIALSVAAALAYAHQRGVVHRDLKPENVFLQPGRDPVSWAPKLLDFGISKPLDAEPLTLTGAIVGTPLYLAPEQVRGEAIDARTDVYQLGAVLFEAIAGGPPYEAPGYELLLSAIVAGRRATLAERSRSVPRGLAEAVERALALRPEDRHGSVVELARAIAPFGPCDPVVARELGLPARRSRAPGLRAAVAAGTIGLVLGAIAGVTFSRTTAVEVTAPPRAPVEPPAPAPPRTSAPTAPPPARTAASDAPASTPPLALTPAAPDAGPPPPQRAPDVGARRRREPIEPRAVETRPAETRPVEARPVEALPVETRPAASAPPPPLAGEMRIDEF